MANKPSSGSAGGEMPPQTRYAKSGDVSIAYQVTGNGAFDLVFVPGFVSNLDAQLEHPGWSFSRLIRFDKLGTEAVGPKAYAAHFPLRMRLVAVLLDPLVHEPILELLELEF